MKSSLAPAGAPEGGKKPEPVESKCSNNDPDPPEEEGKYIYDKVSKQIVKDRPNYEIYVEYAVECFFYLYDGQGFFGFDE